MPKLGTPVQYESVLEGLNTIRPLQLADEVKTVIDTSVLCKNPPSVDKPAVGLLARCSQQGALLKSVPVWADKVITTSFEVSEEEPCKYYRFSQRVLAILAMIDVGVFHGLVNWTDPTYTNKYRQIGEVTYTLLPIVSKNIYFYSEGEPNYVFTIYLIGFPN